MKRKAAKQSAVFEELGAKRGGSEGEKEDVDDNDYGREDFNQQYQEAVGNSYANEPRTQYEEGGRPYEEAMPIAGGGNRGALRMLQRKQNPAPRDTDEFDEYDDE